MDRKKLSASVVALLAGVFLMVGSTWAQFTPQVTGYLAGDPAPGKLVPYYKAKGPLATLIGIENTLGEQGPDTRPFNLDVEVHVTVFTKTSAEVVNFDLCLSPFSFGYVVLQEASANLAQLADLNFPSWKTSGLTRFAKARILSVVNNDIPSEGYVSLRARTVFGSNDGTCNANTSRPSGVPVDGAIVDGSPFPLATWAVLQDIGTGFFATEIPTPTAIVDPGVGTVSGGTGAFGLIPFHNKVIARYDVNPVVGSHTDIYVWLAHNNRSVTAWLDCEDELEISLTLSLPFEINVIDPDLLPGISQCKNIKQYRGVLRFAMPDTGFLWSQINQTDAHFRENFLGYNLECNTFIDPDCDEPSPSGELK